MPIEQKHQLIDDQSVFKIEELQALNEKHITAMKKTYHTLSIIGSQSSGKSTLLNAVFGTTFEELNRKRRVGQTTKGIWYSMDTKDNMMIIDVQGSDSNERQERTKIERRNSLFALAISHTLLINLWIQQIGLFKGSQMAILQIILELNLRLFGSQQPKNIIFVVRDFCQGRQNVEALREKLFHKVEEAWQNIPKPPGKQHIQLKDLFHLNAFFLPSKLQQPEQFQQSCTILHQHLIKLAADKQIIKNNVAMQDIPQYMKNLWETIEADKDVNLPQQKILLSNMKCEEIRKQAYLAFEEEFRDQLEKSQRKLNPDFSTNIGNIVGKMLQKYDEQTTNYIEEEVRKVRSQFVEQIQRKIQLSFSYQIKLIVEQCLRQFSDSVNKNFIKQKNIDAIKILQPESQKKFQQLLHKVCYKKEWEEPELAKYKIKLHETFQSQKDRIVVDSLKDFDRSIKKQIQSLVSNAFYDKNIMCKNFWEHINTSYKELEHRSKNSIVGLYKKLEYSTEQQNKAINEHVERARENAADELRTIIGMKCNDLLYYLMKHFSVDFNLDERQIPRQWSILSVQQIKTLYAQTKQFYINLLPTFSEFKLNLHAQNPLTASVSKKYNRMSSIQQTNSNELLNSVELLTLNRKLEEQMNNQYEEALKKNKQVYMGSIPKWGWILFLIVAFDDILLWIKSPYLAIPVTVILLAVGAVFFLGGSGLANSLINNARRAGGNLLNQATAQAANRVLSGGANRQ